MLKFRNSILLLITFSTIFLLFSSSCLLSQEAETTSEITQEQTSYIKNIFFDLGYGARGVSFGLGFRWWNFSAGLGLAGILSDVPKYRYYDSRTGEPNPTNYADPSFSTEKFPSTTVSFDFSYYYDISDFSIFATLGYYVQSDSVLRKFNGSADESKNVYKDNYYPVGSANATGLAWGLGVQYFISENVNTALAYHNKKGIYLQIGYFWY